MASSHDKHGPSDRRRHRHGRRHLARRRQGRQLGEAHRRQVRHPRASRRFPTDGLKTTIAGTVDFIPVEPFCSTELGERMADMVAEEAIAESGIGAQGRFPGPAVPRGARRSRSNGRSAKRWRPRPAPTTPSPTTTCCAPRAARPLPRHPRALPDAARSPIIWPTGSAPRARRSRCRPPAPRARARSSSASRRSAAAKPTPRSASAPTARSIRKR